MKLDMKELAYISRMYEGVTPISLLSNLDKIEDGSTLFSLMEKEIIVEDELSTAAQAIMDVVANARACARLFIQDRFCLVEKYVYRFNDQLVLVENDEGNLCFSKVETLAGAMEEVAAILGSSPLKSAAVEGLFSYDELVVLLGVIDYTRFFYHKAYLGEADSLLHFDEKAIRHRIQLCRDTDLAQLLTKNYGLQVPDESRWQSAWQALTDKGCLVPALEAPGKMTLSSAYKTFAEGFLIPETLMTLERLAYDSADELTTASSICVSAGLKDLLFLSLGSEDGELVSVSGAELLRFTENFMTLMLTE